MKIAFDAKRVFQNTTGLGNYSRTLLDNLARFHPQHKYTLYAPKVPAEHPFAQRFRTVSANTSFKHLWRSYAIKKDLELDGISLYHGLSNEIPFWLKDVRTVVTIHDVIYKVLPRTYPSVDRWLYEAKTNYACEYADHIIAISEHTKRDLVKYYEVDPQRISVIYQAAQPVFYETLPVKISEVQHPAIARLPSEYLLYVGSITERKNLLTVVKALWQLPEKQRIPLVVIGNGKRYKKQVETFVEAQKLAKWVHWITDLTDTRDLKYLYENAFCLLYPSFYEGFGLPVVEAMLCGTPVITSNVSALLEAGGKYAKLVHPNRTEEMRTAIFEFLENSTLRKEVGEKGKQEAIQRFDPQRLTAQIVELYEKLR